MCAKQIFSNRLTCLWLLDVVKVYFISIENVNLLFLTVKRRKIDNFIGKLELKQDQSGKILRKIQNAILHRSVCKENRDPNVFYCVACCYVPPCIAHNTYANEKNMASVNSIAVLLFDTLLVAITWWTSRCCNATHKHKHQFYCAKIPRIRWGIKPHIVHWMLLFHRMRTMMTAWNQIESINWTKRKCSSIFPIVDFFCTGILFFNPIFLWIEKFYRLSLTDKNHCIETRLILSDLAFWRFVDRKKCLLIKWIVWLFARYKWVDVVHVSRGEKSIFQCV